MNPHTMHYEHQFQRRALHDHLKSVASANGCQRLNTEYLPLGRSAIYTTGDMTKSHPTLSRRL